jgi:hypothetical protein
MAHGTLVFGLTLGIVVLNGLMKFMRSTDEGNDTDMRWAKGASWVDYHRCL